MMQDRLAVRGEQFGEALRSVSGYYYTEYIYILREEGEWGGGYLLELPLPLESSLAVGHEVGRGCLLGGLGLHWHMRRSHLPFVSHCIRVRGRTAGGALSLAATIAGAAGALPPARLVGPRESDCG